MAQAEADFAVIRDRRPDWSPDRFVPGRLGTPEAASVLVLVQAARVTGSAVPLGTPPGA